MNIKTSTKTNVSPFKPKFIKNLRPSRLNFFSFPAGFKKKKNDLLILIFEKPVNVQCVYSLTSTPSAPIIWDKNNNQGKCKALIVNSGNANAHTGINGIKIINKYVLELTKRIKCKKKEILVSSTGVIGEIFDPSIIINSINKLKKTKSVDLIEAAKTIMTTDTYPKTSIKNVKIQNTNINIYGFAKGSGMIQPNMGTMLVYIFIECLLNKNQLKKLIRQNIENSFNSISVDSDTSTSDTLMLFSTSNKKINLKSNKNFKKLSKAVFELMQNLAYQVIKDGEGISKLIEINVVKAKSTNQAKKIAFSVVNSPLVKSAIAGEDANWGRVIMAIGKSYEKINQNKIKVSFGKNTVCKNGQISRKINTKQLNRYMKQKVIKINVDLGLGKFSKTVFGNDLTYEYLQINADYRT